VKASFPARQPRQSRTDDICIPYLPLAQTELKIWLWSVAADSLGRRYPGGGDGIISVEELTQFHAEDLDRDACFAVFAGKIAINIAK
jgi:hypothetical protein